MCMSVHSWWLFDFIDYAENDGVIYRKYFSSTNGTCLGASVISTWKSGECDGPFENGNFAKFNLSSRNINNTCEWDDKMEGCKGTCNDQSTSCV